MTVKVDAHSEVLGHYPWAWTTPNAGDANGRHRRLHRRRAACSPTAVGPRSARTRAPTAARPARATPVRSPRRSLCEAESQFFCDEGPFGKGTGGQLRYRVTRSRARASGRCGSASPVRPRRGGRAPSCARRSRDPARALRAKQASRERTGALHAARRCRATERLADGIAWGKQNLLDLTQRADNLQIRDVDEGKAYPAPLGTVAPRAGSARAIRTTRGSSPPTPSTRRSRRSPRASSRRSPTTPAPCATSR